MTTNGLFINADCKIEVGKTKGEGRIRKEIESGTPNKTPAEPTATDRGRLSAQQVSACSAEIKNKQIESQSWGGNVNDVAARLGKFQKDLFEGRCAGHPEAQAYIAGANKMLGYGGSATGGASNRNVVGNTPPEPVGTVLRNQPDPAHGSQSSLSTPKGISYVGGHKECIKFTPGKPFSDGIYQWFTYYNGCSITLKVCDNMSGKHWGCGYEIKPGKTAKNWDRVTNINRNGGDFFACSTSENGKSVHFDIKTHTCYYHN